MNLHSTALPLVTSDSFPAADPFLLPGSPLTDELALSPKSIVATTSKWVTGTFKMVSPSNMDSSVKMVSPVNMAPSVKTVSMAALALVPATLTTLASTLWPTLMSTVPLVSTPDFWSRFYETVPVKIYV
jgi:hypothetical protein